MKQNSTVPNVMTLEGTNPTPKRFRSFGSQVMLTTASNLLLGVIGLATGVLAARILGVQGRGLLAAIQSWPIFIAAVAQLGLSEAIVFHATRNPAHARGYMISSLSAAIGASVIFVIAGYCFMPLLLAKQPATVISAARLYLILLIPLEALAGISVNAIRSRNNIVLWNALRFLSPVGWLGVLAVAALVQPTPYFVATGYIVMMLVLSLPLVYFVQSMLPGRLRPEKQKMLALLRYGLPTLASNAPLWLNLRLDQMLMAGLLPPALLGLYVVAVAWSSVASPALSAIGSVLFPRLASVGPAPERTQAFAKGCRLGAFCSVFIAVALAGATPTFLPVLFGPQFRTAVPCALILVLAGAFAGFNFVMENGLRGLGRPKAVMVAEWSGLAVISVTLLLLLKPFGIMGAAVSSLLGYATITVVLLSRSSALTGCRPIDLLIPTFEEVALVREALRIGSKLEFPSSAASTQSFPVTSA